MRAGAGTGLLLVQLSALVPRRAASPRLGGPIMAAVLLPLLVVGLAATLLIAPLYGLRRPTPPAPTRIVARPGRRLCSSRLAASTPVATNRP